MQDAMSLARQVLTDPSPELTLDGRPVQPVDVTEDMILNYHQLCLLWGFAGHHGRAVLLGLSYLGTAETQELSTVHLVQATAERAFHVESSERLESALSAGAAMLTGVKDAEVRDLLQLALHHLGYNWLYRAAARRAVSGLIERTLSELSRIEEQGKATFRQIQSVLPVLMGRPTESQIDAAIDAVEGAQEGLEDLQDAFLALETMMALPEVEHLVLHEAPTAPANSMRMQLIGQRLELLLQDEWGAGRIEEAILRTHSILLTIVTAIQQIDQRLAALGVVATA